MVNYTRLGISEDFRDKEWEDIFDLEVLSSGELAVYRKIFNAAKSWCSSVVDQKTSMGLFMYGSNGSGKSTLGCLLLKELLKNAIPCMRVTAVRLQKDFYDGWRVPKYALLKGVLFVDELGKEYKTKNEHSEMVIEYILKYRTERRLPSVLASNADADYLYKRYGETVNSILKGKFIPIAFPEVDLRQRLALEESKRIIGG